MRGNRRNSARYGVILVLFIVAALAARWVRRRSLSRQLSAYHLRTQGEIEQQLAAAQRRQGRIYPFQRSRHA